MGGVNGNTSKSSLGYCEVLSMVEGGELRPRASEWLVLRDGERPLLKSARPDVMVPSEPRVKLPTVASAAVPLDRSGKAEGVRARGRNARCLQVEGAAAGAERVELGDETVRTGGQDEIKVRGGTRCRSGAEDGLSTSIRADAVGAAAKSLHRLRER